jgi:hypothetical protein
MEFQPGDIVPPADPYAPIKAAAAQSPIQPFAKDPWTFGATPASFTPPPVATPASPAPPQSGGFETSLTGQRISGAESGNRNIPNYRYDPTHTAGGYFQITDTNWQHYAPQIGIDLKQYPNAMSAPENLQGQVAGKMYSETGIMPWKGNPRLSGLVDETVGGMQQQDAQSRADLRRIGGESEKLGAQLAQMSPRDPESLRALAHYREKMEQYQEASLQTALHPPAYNVRDGMQRMGSLAVIIGMLAGRFSKTPMIAALNAGAAAMEAEKKNDEDGYKRAMDQWKVSTDALNNMAKFEHDMYKDTLDDEKTTWGQKMDLIKGQAEMLNNQRVAALAQSGDAFRLSNAVLQMQKTSEKFDNDYQRMQLALRNQDRLDRMVPVERQALAAAIAAVEDQAGPMSPDQKDNFITKWEADQARIKEGANVLPPYQGPDTWEGLPNKPPPGIDPTAWDYAVVYVKTKVQPPVGWGSGGLRKQFNQAVPVAQQALGITPEDQGQEWIDYKAKEATRLAISRGFGPSSQAGRNLISLNTVADHLSMLRQYADALQNHDLQLANRLVNRMATETGYPEVISYALAGTITADEVTRLLTTTGGTKEDREGLQRLLANYAQAPEQLHSAIDTASNFVRSRYAPLRQAYALGDKGREKEFDEQFMTPEAREAFSAPPKPPIGPGGGAAPAAGVVVQNGWRYDAKTHQPLGPVQ